MTSADVVDLAAGAVLLTAVLIAWRRQLGALVGLLAVQGVALAVIPLALGIHRSDATLLVVAAIVLVLRGAILPGLLRRAVAALPDTVESTPLLNATASLLVAGVLTVIAFAVGQPLVDLGSASAAVPAALAVVLIGVFVMVSRRRAISQTVGFLVLDNGITATALLITGGVPLIVELGASLDVLFAVVVIGLLTGRLQQLFGSTDLDQLRELRDR